VAALARAERHVEHSHMVAMKNASNFARWSALMERFM
jgi:hypothetical protein